RQAKDAGSREPGPGRGECWNIRCRRGSGIVDEYQSTCVSSEARSVHAGEEGALFVSNQYDRTFLIGAIEQHSKLLGDSRRGKPTVSSLAPAKSRAIVAADARGPGDFGLNPSPRSGHASRGGFEDHHWRTLAHTVDLQLLTAGIDEPARTLITVTLECGCDALVRCACQHEKSEECDDGSNGPPQT